jgi:predicted RNA-binding protein with PIN domain
MKYLIDGYNLIFECGLNAKQINSVSLAKARRRLLTTITSRLPAEDLPQTTVVFDAQKIPLSGQTEKTTVGGITVMYSIHYEDADSMIEELIAAHCAPKNLTVVSSDHRIQKATMRRNAISIDSQVWFDWLKRNRAKEKSLPKNRMPLPKLTESELTMFSQALEAIDQEPLAPETMGTPDEDSHDRVQFGENDNEFVEESFNPFPDHYADDLLEDELDDWFD